MFLRLSAALRRIALELLRRGEAVKPRRSSPRNNAFDAFLFASVGDEENGMPLTVLSALARLGVDPWDEAGRLAALPRTAATEALAEMIATLPAVGAQRSRASDIAALLVQLLPTADTPASSTPAQGQAVRAPGPAIFVISLILLCELIFGMQHRAEPPPDAPSVRAAATPSPPLD